MSTRRERIYHLALREDWDTAKVGHSGYRASTLGEDLADVGFIHCSYVGQVRRVADLIYRHRTDVLLLTLDPDRLRSRIVDEPADGGGEEEFPHVYGPIDFDAVVEVTPLALLDDGTLDINIEAPAD